METTGLIQLPQFRFPEHGLIQEWLNGTDFGERYFLVMIESKNTSKMRVTTPALEPKRGEEKFMLTLQGDDEILRLSKKYASLVLDFHNR